jgi:2'-5' RNA ligase
MPRARTQGFLEEAWSRAKGALPGWAFAAIHNQARAVAGGRASGEARRMRAQAKLQKSNEGFMIALPIASDIAAQLVLPEGEAGKDLHITLVFLGPSAMFTAEGIKLVSDTAAEVAAEFEPLRGRIGGLGRFFNGEKDVIYASPDVPGLSELREALCARLDAAGVPLSENHGFNPHITLAYVEPGVAQPESVALLDLAFDAACVYVGGQRTEIPFTLKKPITQAPAVKAYKLALFGSTPNAIELARGEAFVGPIGETLLKHYLEPLGLTRDDVLLGNTRDAAGLNLVVSGEVAQPGCLVVALGKGAAQDLGVLARFALPHPGAIRKHGDSGEVARKLRAIRKALDSDGASAPQSALSTESRVAPAEGNGGTGQWAQTIQINKALGDEEQRIVYGVVLDPYTVDAHNDWIPPAAIQKTAHGFMERGPVVGLHHTGVADAKVVESFVEEYPTKSDRVKAMRGEPHRAYRRKYGDEWVHSGAWVIGVKLSPTLWEAHKAGEIEAFSIGGVGVRTPTTRSAMPAVTFVELAPKI